MAKYDDLRPGERLIDELKRLDRRVSRLERASPAALNILDDDENLLVSIGDLGSSTGGLRLYAADGSVLWEQTRAI